MIQKFKNDIFRNIKNIPGWRTKRKMIIIECDDWGGIRMPSKKVFNALLNKGLNIDTSRFNRYDTLANSEDLEKLFEVLYSVKDINNRPAVMTPLTVVANPDFEKIRTSGFNQYYYESFKKTLDRYYPNENVLDIWKQGISEKIFIPELHGLDHLASQIWMDQLNEKNTELLQAFNHGFVSIHIPGIPPPASEFRAEYYFVSPDQKSLLENSIKKSVSLFSELFDFKPSVFVAGNGIFHPDFDKTVAEVNIKFLNVFHAMPYPAKEGKLKFRYFITGQKGPVGLTYYIRNCSFEPTDSFYQGIETTLKQISCAFRWHKPAIISTHRVNFTGEINKENREKGLQEFSKLLAAIVKKWPDVEFLPSKEAYSPLVK